MDYEAEYGTGQINNSRNIVTIRTSLHTYLHTNLYYTSVNYIVEEAYKKSCLTEALRFMKNSLKSLSNICP